MPIIAANSKKKINKILTQNEKEVKNETNKSKIKKEM